MRSWTRWLLFVGLIAALAVTFIFAIRAVQHARPLRQHTDQAIRPWMTVPFIAHSYHVPATALYQALGLQPVRGDRRVISDIAREQGRTVADVETTLRHTIGQIRSSSPPPAQPRPTTSPAAP